MDTKKIKIEINSFSNKIKKLYKTLTPEKVMAFWFLISVGIILLFSAVLVLNQKITKVIPTLGGSINEGIIGTPRFINPVLASTDQDNDLTTLVFAGLTKRDETGSVILDMAEKIDTSNDNLHYDVTIKEDAEFHDGKKVTSDDIIYTISLIQNSLIKSPHKVEFEGVTIEKKTDRELIFSLKKPYPLFMNVLSIGILPKHVWKNLNDDQFSLSDYNINAIGSGPFMISDVKRDSGIPVSISLKSFKNYTLHRPYLDEINIFAYQNEKYLLQAYDNGDIDRIHGITPEKVKSLSIPENKIQTSLLPRTITIFFNPNKADFLSDKNIRLALNLAINKDSIVKNVLNGYGKIINSPYPFEEGNTDNTYQVEEAKKTLSDSKYFKKKDSKISLNLATVNTDEMKKTAEMIKKYWEEIGIETNISVYEPSDLNQSIIKDRNFQVLLFGSITSTPADLYAFWHSSQRNYPGLNISNYASQKLDKQLEVLREDGDELDRIDAYENVKKEWEEETPSIFLYAPKMIYVVTDKIKTILPKNSFDNSDRFLLAEYWYKNTERVWLKTDYEPIIKKIEWFIH